MKGGCARMRCGRVLGVGLMCKIFTQKHAPIRDCKPALSCERSRHAAHSCAPLPPCDVCQSTRVAPLLVVAPVLTCSFHLLWHPPRFAPANQPLHDAHTTAMHPCTLSMHGRLVVARHPSSHPCVPHAVRVRAHFTHALATCIVMRVIITMRGASVM
jgi:hypothetical protein